MRAQVRTLLVDARAGVTELLRARQADLHALAGAYVRVRVGGPCACTLRLTAAPCGLCKRATRALLL